MPTPACIADHVSPQSSYWSKITFAQVTKSFCLSVDADESNLEVEILTCKLTGGITQAWWN